MSIKERVLFVTLQNIEHKRASFICYAHGLCERRRLNEKQSNATIERRNKCRMFFVGFP